MPTKSLDEIEKKVTSILQAELEVNKEKKCLQKDLIRLLSQRKNSVTPDKLSRIEKICKRIS